MSLAAHDGWFLLACAAGTVLLLLLLIAKLRLHPALARAVANPTALLQSAVLMLRHLDEPEAADKVQRALETVYAERKTLTRDVGGTAGTSQFADAVLAAMR
jgi:isocitrate dehydrogenase